ncbi:response regulator [Leptolyngbya sp. DQ-M1]|uniref:response regulator transcription factor n=1 Tax=Leptolyngbya sp. DQ-M1 TaxID=2933920 RepID=UPI00329A7F9E
MPHVLLVDDEAPLRDSLSYALQKEGYEVTTASDGAAALKLFHKQVPDVILLDLMLPEIGGMEVCWRIRAFSDVPIVMLTAKDQDIDKVWGLEAGADDYITKPFNTRELLARIRAVWLCRKNGKVWKPNFL